MRKILMTGSVIGCLLFGALFLLTFASVSAIDQSAQGFIIAQIEKELSQHQVAGINLGKAEEKLAWLKNKYADDIASMKNQLGSGLRIKITEILEKICNLDCLKKSGIEIKDVTEDSLHERIAQLTDVSAKLTEMIKGKYYKIISGSLTDAFSLFEKVIDGSMKIVFESKSRKCDRAELEDGMAFAHRFLKSVDAFVPGWSEGARTGGSRPGQKRLIDLQIGSSGDAVARMDFVLVA